MCACVRACFALTYSDNVGHPAGALNPKETRNQRGPVFPNRSPARQPSISHGCKVAGSTFSFKIPKTTQIRSSTMNSMDHLWVLTSASDVRSLYLVKHFFSLFFLFCFKSESGLIKMKHLRSLTSGSVLTPANAGCYNYPAGVSESPPTADAICLLTSTRATAEPDFPRLCE